MITLEQFRKLEHAVSRARGVREAPRDMTAADLRCYSASAVLKDIADLNAQGDHVMAARTAMNEQLGFKLETW